MTKHLTHCKIECEACGQKYDFFFNEDLLYACSTCGSPLVIDHSFPGIKHKED